MNVVAITGATSMIGISIINSCLEHNVSKIYAIVRNNCDKLNRLPDNDRIKVIKCNADKYLSLVELIHEKCDVFYHIAWSLTGQNRNNDLIEQVRNIQYTIEAVKAASELGCEVFIGAGSQAEYGLCSDKKISPDSPVNPTQPYGIAKYAAGKMAMQQANKMGINCIWVRIFSVYGIWEKPNTLIQSTINQLRRGEIPQLTKGIQLWDYLFSEDAGEAFCLIGEKIRENKIYCLGSGIAKPIKTYIEEVRDIVNPSMELQFGKVPYTSNSIMNLCANISSLTRDIGWVSKTGFKAGIEKTYHFLKDMK